MNFLNSTYSNEQVPNKWKCKLNFKDEVLRTISKDKLFFNYLYQKRSESVNIGERVTDQKSKSNLIDSKIETTDNFSKQGKRFKDSIINNLKKISFRSIDANNSKFLNNPIEDNNLPDIRKKYDEILICLLYI